MDSFEELFARARKNEEISRKLFEIEVAILNIASTQAFFEHLVKQVSKKFGVSGVSLTLINNPANEALIQALKKSESLDGHWITIPGIEFLAATKGARKPLLINEVGKPIVALLPAADRANIGSVAILPLQMEGRLAGSMNLVDVDVERYTPDMDSYFLYQLSVKASLCLSAVVARERADFLATRDPLTKLRNRRELEEALEREVSRVVRHGNPLSLAFVDCDDFKQVNDRHGHDMGDKYLQHMARCMEEVIRKTDMVFRYAGDEFIILLPDQDGQGALFTAERLQAYLYNHPLIAGDIHIPLKASIGLACSSELTQVTPRALLKLADTALYQNKSLKHFRFPVSEGA
jgi:diguanylate cyclase (GGDEF)-like protein